VGHLRPFAGEDNALRLFSYLSLRQWLTLPYLALVFGVALLIGTLSYRTGSQAVDTVANHLLLETVERIGQAVDRHVVGSAAVLEAAFPNGMPVSGAIDADLATLRTRFWIATSLHIDPNNYVYYGNRQGQFIGLWRFNAQDAELRVKLKAERPRDLFPFQGINGVLGPVKTEERLFDPRVRPWYKAGADRESHTWTAIYIDFRTSELVATRARRVLDAQGGLEGVVATDLSLHRLNEFVRRLSVSAKAVAFIIEPDGKLIASSRSANVARQADGSNARISASDSDDALQRAAYQQVREYLAAGQKMDSAVTQRFTGPDDESIELAFNRVRDQAGLDWITVVAVPRSDFMQGVTENVRRTALIGVVASLAALVLGLTILGWIGRDIRRLTQAAREVGEGRLEAKIDVQRDDEIGELANSFRHMQHRLRTDLLTGLVNRDVMTRAIDERVRRTRRVADDKPFAVLFVDLNRFKLINDRLGHDAGDRALVEVGMRLRDATRKGDLVARFSGDEFVLLINEVPSREAAEQVRQHVEAALGQPLRSLGVNTLPGEPGAGGSVGLSVYPADGQTAEDLVKHADRDMYERKRALRQDEGR
jgi:diguanylate cyclase (GGDEF)-like protein